MSAINICGESVLAAVASSLAQTCKTELQTAAERGLTEEKLTHLQCRLDTMEEKILSGIKKNTVVDLTFRPLPVKEPTDHTILASTRDSLKQKIDDTLATLQNMRQKVPQQVPSIFLA
jgi:hypothetical protein